MKKDYSIIHFSICFFSDLLSLASIWLDSNINLKLALGHNNNAIFNFEVYCMYVNKKITKSYRIFQKPCGYRS